MQLTCADCGVTWQRETRPGKLPKRCAECTRRWDAQQGRLRERGRPLERRHGNAPCAGCGKLLHGSETSLPAGERTCRSCRRAGLGPRRGRTSDCAVCRATFYPHNHRQLTCSRKCGAEHRRANFATMARPRRPCPDCRTSVTWPLVYCAPCGEQRRAANNQRKNLRRRAGGTQVMSIRELAERDRWQCHLCRRRVGQTLRYPHPRAASRDHLVPVVAGGTNDPTNLALAHWDCNVRRRTGGTVQLLLVV